MMEDCTGFKTRFALGATAALLAISGALLLPAAWASWQRHQAASDPVRLVTLSLQDTFSPERARREVQAALKAKDPDLAQSLVTLADQQKVSIPPQLRAQVKAAQPSALGDFARGFISGRGQSTSGMIGTATSDLMVIGDVRDLVRETNKLNTGQSANTLVMGLAAVGIAVTAATVISVGAALPARGGVTLIKATAKAGKLSPALARSLSRHVRAAVDIGALRRAVSALRRGEFNTGRRLVTGTVRLDRLAPLQRMAVDTGTMVRRAGPRAAQDALALARNGPELRRFSKVATARGKASRGVFKVLGRGAIVAAGTLWALSWWLAGTALWLVLLLGSLALVIMRLGWRWRPRLRRAR